MVKSNLLFDILLGLSVRLAVLVLICMLAGRLPMGFYGGGDVSEYDDNRYLAGGKYYAENAESPVDVVTFTNAYLILGDQVGLHMLYASDNPLEASTPIWYWVVCLLMYFTKTEISVRLFNILIGVLTIYYTYKLTEVYRDSRTAHVAALLMAVLPYPVFFSCFAYKDSLIMFIYVYCLYAISVYRKRHRYPITGILRILLLLFILMGMRGGLSIAYIGILLFVFFFGGEIRIPKKVLRVMIGAGCVLLLLLVVKYGHIIVAKLGYYVVHRQTEENSTLVRYASVNSIRDLYRLPFLYMASILMPIGLTLPIASWYSVASIAGFFMTPVAIGCTVYIVRFKKYSRAVYYLTLLLYLVSIIASIGNPRHYYSMVAFTYIAFADYICQTELYERRVLFLVSGLFTVLLLLYYLKRYI